MLESRLLRDPSDHRCEITGVKFRDGLEDCKQRVSGDEASPRSHLRDRGPLVTDLVLFCRELEAIGFFRTIAVNQTCEIVCDSCPVEFSVRSTRRGSPKRRPQSQPCCLPATRRSRQSQARMQARITDDHHTTPRSLRLPRQPVAIAITSYKPTSGPRR
jgi:hypothetical protein